ncbi:MAG: ORF6N domain-containing protein [Planctomycetes bacterium]|nr:ORF6N domain-containing protein [Planctomycetota bacterium]
MNAGGYHDAFDDLLAERSSPAVESRPTSPGERLEEESPHAYHRAVSVVAPRHIDRRILLVRGQTVMLDADLARLYGVSTKVLNQAVRRNSSRFPADFMFRLTPEEVAEALRSQFVTSNVGRGGRRNTPFAFTEQGIAMLSSVLRSERAIQVNIAIMRAFVRLRQLLGSNELLARRLDDIEKRHHGLARVVVDLITQISERSVAPKRRERIGFRAIPRRT